MSRVLSDGVLGRNLNPQILVEYDVIFMVHLSSVETQHLPLSPKVFTLVC